MIFETIPDLPTYHKTNFLYLSCILIFLLAIGSLPFLKVDVSVNTPALIRPSSEVNTIRSISSGRIKESYMFENKKVRKGDVLYIIESEILTEQEKYATEEVKLHEMSIGDLRTLIASADKGRAASVPLFKNALYRQIYFTYHQQVSEALNHLNKAKQDHNRQHKLYIEKVIAPAEFESYQFELQKAEDVISQIKETHLSQWHGDLRNLIEENHELESKLTQIQKEEATLMIKSPLNGTLQNLAGIYANCVVSANQEIVQVSPDTSLIAIAYVNPNDIGLLRKKMMVRLMVETFNYNQWGVVSGWVLEIPKDVKILNNKPVFEVRCSLNQDFLQLKNGYKGFLKKGMTMQARFLVTRRSLWQLLYDKVDDWINPYTFKI